MAIHVVMRLSSVSCPGRVATFVCLCGEVFRLAILLTTMLTIGAATLEADATVLRGRLQEEPGKVILSDAPLILLDPAGKKTTLFGDVFSEAQLRDTRLAGRKWEFEGFFVADGRFEIQKLFTVRGGRRHRVTYYCEICHIYTHEPGRCMCCQEETELREIPEP